MNRLNKIILAIALALPMSAMAQSGYVYADIVNVQPRYDTQIRYENRRVCDNVNYYDNRYDNRYNGRGHYDRRTSHDDNDVAEGVVGAIVGAAIGSQIGDGSGQTAATVAGAAIGAGIAASGDDDKHGRYDDRHDRRDNRRYDYRHNNGRRGAVRCWNERVPTRYQYIQGYDVTYHYRGYRGTVFTRDRPYGDDIRVYVRY